MKPVDFLQHWNQQATFCPSPQCLVDQSQVQKPILVVATDQMPDHSQSRDDYAEFPTGAENMGGSLQNLMVGFSQYMGRAWGVYNDV